MDSRTKYFRALRRNSNSLLIVTEDIKLICLKNLKLEKENEKLTGILDILGKTFREASSEYRQKLIDFKIPRFPLYGLEVYKGEGMWAYLLSREVTKEYEERSDVAIAVQISRSIMRSVVEFIEREKVSAHVVLFSNKESPIGDPVYLDYRNPDEWRKVVRDFTKLLNRTQLEMGDRDYHVFLGIPAALALGLGCAFDKYKRAFIYDWVPKKYDWVPKGGTYSRVLTLPKDLR